MPKATLEFDLPEEEEEFNHAVHCMDYYVTLSDLAESLRQKVKHDAPSPKDWDEVREWFREILGELSL